MKLPHWKYALSVFGIAFVIAAIVFVAVALFGGIAFGILVIGGGLLFMFYILAREGPR